MGAPVPVDDLPASIVPTSDLPDATGAVPTAPKAAPVTVSPHEKMRSELLKGGADPRLAGMAADLSYADAQTTDPIEKAAYTAGGSVTDVLSRAGVPPEIAALGGVSTNVGIQAIPMAAGGGVAKKGTEEAGKALGRRWMQQALMPKKSARESGDAAVAIEHLLKDETNQLSKGGVERLTKQIDDLDNALTDAIKNAKGDVSTLTVLQEQKKAIDQFKDGLDHAETGEAVKQEFLKFFSHPHVAQALQIPAETAQKMKRAIYKEIGERGFSRPTMEIRSAGSRGEEAGKKAVAAGLNESLGRVSPQAAAINKEMAPRIKTRDLVEERVGQHGNKMDVGFGWLLAKPWLIPGWLADRSPYIKSYLAREAYKGRMAEGAGELGGAAVGASQGLPPKDERR